MRKRTPFREGRRPLQFGVSISREVVAEIDRLVEAGEWRSRSDFFEKTARDALHRWREERRRDPTQAMGQLQRTQQTGGGVGPGQ